MTLLTLDRIGYDIGDLPLLRDASLTIDENERVCLIGRNGAGKSTLLRLIEGSLQPDSGEIRRRGELRVSRLEQGMPGSLDVRVREYVGEGLSHLRTLLERYRALTAGELDDGALARLSALERHIDTEGAWHVDTRIDAILTDMGLPADSPIGELSGGWQRRAGLARALVGAPDLLLLDEPTNHLDLATIEWLEQRIRAYAGSVLFVTHDRTFLERLATRIVELDRARLTSWPGDYANFLRRKAEQAEAEAADQARFEKVLAREEAWIRQGIEARRTRNEGRVRALERMRAEQTERRRFEAPGTVRMDIQRSSHDSGKRVLELRRVSHGYDDTDLIRDFSLRVLRGDRIGLIGNNGVGKSTLIGILLGSITPREGEVLTGTGLEIGHFDPVNARLDPARTVAEAVADGADFVRIGGRDRHIVSYLGDFLFSPARVMARIAALSGGERNRVLLARLFARPSNLLVLDEPTNDLDLETLEVLEAQLTEYDGTLLVVSHDRAFLDNVVTRVLVFEADGRIHAHIGGYSDWARLGRKLAEKERPRTSTATATAASARPEPRKPVRPARPGKLSYALQRELDALPDRIEALEEEVERLTAEVARPGFYEQPHETMQARLDELGGKQAELDRAVERWAELEEMRTGP